MIRFICALLLAATPAFACEVVPRAVVGLDLVQGVPTVQVAVDGEPARFVLDTGAARTTISEAAVRRLGLPLDRWVGTTLQGIGGVQQHQDAAPGSIVLDGIELHQVGLYSSYSIAVASLPFHAASGRSIDGLLGRDLLGGYDLDLDIPDMTVTLASVIDCRGDFVPWTQPHAAVPSIEDYGKRLVFMTGLDGHPMRTLVDSGSAVSLLSAPGVIRAGLPSGRSGVGTAAMVAGVGPQRVMAQPYQFGSLAVGDITAHSVTILATNVHLLPLLDLLLGVNWLRYHRVWLSFATGQVFVAAP